MSTSSRSSSAARETSTQSSSASISSSSNTKTPNNSSIFTKPSNHERRSSPVSPSRLTRLQEKEEMQNLNDRLVIYIDTVRRLESENSRLQSIVYSYNESSRNDVGEIKKIYERELEDAKRLIDELAKDKARYEIEVTKQKASASDANAKLDKLNREIDSLETKVKALEAENLEYKSRCELFQSDLARREKELERLRPHSSDQEKSLNKLKKQLEDETLLRVDLENKNQTLKEELAFKAQVYDKEIDQLRSSKRVEIEQVDVRLRDEYDSRLVAELNRIREDTEFKIREMKDEVERRYQNKFADSDSTLKRSQHTTSSLREEIVSLRSKCDEYSGEIKSLQAKITSYEGKVRTLEDKLRQLQGKYEKDLVEREEQLSAVRKELQDLLIDYQDLYDVKIALDQEISTYKKLLESEEARLNITSSTASLSQAGVASPMNLNSSYLEQSGGGGGAGARGKKRRIAANAEVDETSSLIGSAAAAALSAISSNYAQSHESKCGVHILEHDFEGKHVKLVNSSEREVALGGWVLRRVADGQEHEYKFAKSVVIKPTQGICVWSANAGGTHEPASGEFVLGGQQKWPVGEKMITVINDKDANEQARRESQRTTLVTSEKRLRATPTRGHTSSSIITTTTTTSSSSSSSSESNSDKSTNGSSKFFGLWRS